MAFTFGDASVGLALFARPALRDSHEQLPVTQCMPGKCASDLVHFQEAEAFFENLAGGAVGVILYHCSIMRVWSSAA